MSKLGAIGHRLYTGEVSYDFIGRRRRWYTALAILIAVSLLSLAWRGLDFGIEFKGGADFKAAHQVNAQTATRCRTRFAIPAFQISTRRPSTRSATTRSGANPHARPDRRSTEGSGRDRQRGGDQPGPGRVQPHRGLLGEPDHRARTDCAGGIPGTRSRWSSGSISETPRCRPPH